MDSIPLLAAYKPRDLKDYSRNALPRGPLADLSRQVPGKRAAMKIAGARVENKRLAPSLATFMLGGAPKAHEVLPEK